jgi:hypothetical protein
MKKKELDAIRLLIKDIHAFSAVSLLIKTKDWF